MHNRKKLDYTTTDPLHLVTGKSWKKHHVTEIAGKMFRDLFQTQFLPWDKSYARPAMNALQGLPKTQFPN